MLLAAGLNLQCSSSFFESAVWTVSDEPYLPTAIYVSRRWNPLPSLIRWAACCCYALSDMSTLTFNTGVIHQIHVLDFFRLEALPEIRAKRIAIFFNMTLLIPSPSQMKLMKEEPSQLLLRITYSALQSSPWSPSIPFQSVILIPLLPHSPLLTTFRLSLN